MRSTCFHFSRGLTTAIIKGLLQNAQKNETTEQKANRYTAKPSRQQQQQQQQKKNEGARCDLGITRLTQV